MLGWLVEDRQIEPHIPVWDKSKRTDGILSREDFTYDPVVDNYTCPNGKVLQTYRRNFSKPRKTNGSKDGFIRYRASKHDCEACPLKAQCCPKDHGRRLMRSVHEAARDVARDIRKTDAYMTSFIERRKVEMLFAHLKRYIGLRMMRLRGPKGATEQFQLAATAKKPPETGEVGASNSANLKRNSARPLLAQHRNGQNTDFFNSIRTKRTLARVYSWSFVVCTFPCLRAQG